MKIKKCNFIADGAAGLWLRSMTVYFCDCLSFLANSPTSHKSTGQLGPHWKGQSLHNLLYYLQRVYQVVLSLQVSRPQKEVQSYICPSVSFQVHQLHVTYSPLGRLRRGGTRNITIFEMLPHRIKHQGWGIVFPPNIQFSSVQSLSRVRLFATPWIAACQAARDSIPVHH